MNVISLMKKNILSVIKETLNCSKKPFDKLRANGLTKNGLANVDEKLLNAIQVNLNVDKGSEHGDISCNAALIIAKQGERDGGRANPREVAEKIKDALLQNKELCNDIEKIDIAGPGFINLFLKKEVWLKIIEQLSVDTNNFFALEKDEEPKKYLVEYVSANPTGPLHLGHGRGGMIGDVLSNILSFIGHTVHREFYINDVGNQIKRLGQSFKIRCQQELGQEVSFLEDGYAGQYLIDLAKKFVAEHGEKVLENSDEFFAEYAKKEMLALLKQTLDGYGVQFDEWFSEKSLADSGAVAEAIEELRKKDLVYDKDDALWFKSTQFGDEKDRVIVKKGGVLTYIASDIAYHKNKFERGYDFAINMWGQDHHGYVTRLKATMEALGFDKERLHVILFQMVSIKKNDAYVKMSKRAGNVTELADVVKTVGKDVARFFYLNRKAEAHLDFDLETALKKTEENPVYYIQYAYVRIGSVIKKAEGAISKGAYTHIEHLAAGEINLLKKICNLESLLKTISKSYQTHLLAYYTLELAKSFHSYYNANKIIDVENIPVSQMRLLIVGLVRKTLGQCLDLLGLSKPEKM